jgi:hypothetical protein
MGRTSRVKAVRGEHEEQKRNYCDTDRGCYGTDWASHIGTAHGGW